MADAIVNTIRAGAGIRPFSLAEAEELIQFAVRRGLVGAREGDEVLGEVRAGKGRGSATRKTKPPKSAPRRPPPFERDAKKPVAKAPAKKTVKKTVKKAASKKTATPRKVAKKQAPKKKSFAGVKRR
ncbi:MAG TPA: hypothetical protein VGA37_16860 [Gemmatimonadales bacterium]